MIRSKFRCMGIEARWDHTQIVKMRPVCKHTSGSPEDAVENKSFWDATPAGEIELTYRSPDHLFKVGDSYYVDMVETESAEGAWTLGEVTENSSTVTVKFRAPWGGTPLSQGHIEISVQNKTTFPRFIGRSSSRWTVTFSPG